MTESTAAERVTALLNDVSNDARDADVFGDVTVDGCRLICAAKESAEPAYYRLEPDAGRLWVSLVMKDRWLSESIEADLLHTGDKIEELIEEELAELDAEVKPLKVEHFRSDDMLFTFRTPLPLDPNDADPEQLRGMARSCLLAYEAAFRELGDMSESEEV